jgi:hypothetical protein
MLNEKSLSDFIFSKIADKSLFILVPAIYNSKYYPG